MPRADTPARGVMLEGGLIRGYAMLPGMPHGAAQSVSRPRKRWRREETRTGATMGDEAQPGQGGGRQDGDPVFRNVDLCKWAVWRAKPRAKRRERYPLLGMGAKRAIWRTKTRQKCPKRHPLVKMGAKRAICGPFPCQKCPKRHPLPTMGAKSAIWQTKTRQKCPKRHPLPTMGAKSAICGPFPRQKRSGDLHRSIFRTTPSWATPKRSHDRSPQRMGQDAGRASGDRPRIVNHLGEHIPVFRAFSPSRRACFFAGPRPRPAGGAASRRRGCPALASDGMPTRAQIAGHGIGRNTDLCKPPPANRAKNRPAQLFWGGDRAKNRPLQTAWKGSGEYSASATPKYEARVFVRFSLGTVLATTRGSAGRNSARRRRGGRRDRHASAFMNHLGEHNVLFGIKTLHDLRDSESPGGCVLAQVCPAQSAPPRPAR